MCMFSRSREFRQHRWDLEEEAENLIQEQSEDDQGWVWLP